MNNYSLSRHIAGALVAVFACAAAWFMLPLAVFSPRLIVLVPVMLSLICAYSGWAWAAAGALSMVVCAWIGGGAAYACAAVLGLALPVAVQYVTYRRRIDFRRAVCINAGAFLALGFCALGLLRLWQGDLADLQAAYVRSLWDSQVSFDLLGGGMLRSLEGRARLLTMFASKGYLSADLIEQLQTAPSGELYSRCIDYIIYNLRFVVNYTLTGNLASSALFAGVTMTAWPRMISVRRADTPNMPFVPLRDWFIPAETALYACGIYLVATLILPFMPEWWYSVDYAIKQLVITLMCIQGVAAMERRLRKDGVRRGIRGFVIFFVTFTFQTVVVLTGVVSTLAGSHGAISTWIKKKMEDDEEN